MKAILGARVHTGQLRRTRHYLGLPAEVGGKDQIDLPDAEIALIELDESGVFLIRYLINGDFAGDTWHQTVEEAKDQARYEYGTIENDWIAIPVNHPHPIVFIRSRTR
jgi:hypothetical protein